MTKYVDQAVLRFCLEGLSEWHEQVAKQSVRHVYSLLPVKLALGSEESAPYEEKDDQVFLDRFMRVSGSDSDHPYFDPFSQSWLKASYAHSNVATFRKRTFNRSWNAGAWSDGQIRLDPNFAQIFADNALMKGGERSRIPAVAAAIWFATMAQVNLDDDIDWAFDLPPLAADLVQSFREWLGFSEDAWRVIFYSDPDAVAYYERWHEERNEVRLSAEGLLSICTAAAPPTADLAAIRQTLEADEVIKNHGAKSPEELAARLFLPVSAIQDMLWVLWHKKSLILTGPPGVGKTHLARELAAYVAEDRTWFVQFHPTFSYEYFVSGYRPTTDESGNLSYSLSEGPLLEAVNAASRDIDSPHVLLIDEINRANVSSVFGELLSAMEYRNSPIRLQYGNPGGDDKSSILVSDNFLLIATMNNADRSVGSFDAALRRRFGFYECNPLKPPFQSVLGDYLTAMHPTGRFDWIASWIEELNTKLPDPDYAIGGSYFFGRMDLGKEAVRRTIEFEIRPFLDGKLGLEGIAGLVDLLDIRLIYEDPETALGSAPEAEAPSNSDVGRGSSTIEIS